MLQDRLLAPAAAEDGRRARLGHDGAGFALIRRRHVNSRLRHYRVNLAFVFHAIELGLTRAAYCKTTVQRADFLTKALPVGAFRAAAAFVYPDYEFAKL